MTRMKKHILMISLAVAGSIFSACSKEQEMDILIDQETIASADAFAYHAPTFAEPDKSKKLSGTPSENLKAIFEATGPSIITSIGRMEITEDQYQEIAEFTTDLVKGKSSQTEKYREIFSWITKNINYGQSDRRVQEQAMRMSGLCQPAHPDVPHAKHPRRSGQRICQPTQPVWWSCMGLHLPRQHLGGERPHQRRFMEDERGQ